MTVVSIFINPLQFGPSEDFSNIPVIRMEMSQKLRKAEADVLLMPDASSIYHKDSQPILMWG